MDVAGQTGRCDKHDAGLRVKHLICQCGSEIEARLAWPVDNLAGSYNISWRQDCKYFNKSSTLQNLVAKSYITQVSITFLYLIILIHLFIIIILFHNRKHVIILKA